MRYGTPTWEPWTGRWTYESTKYSIEQQKTQKKVQFIDTFERRRKAFGSSFFIIIILLSGRKRIRLFGCKPVLLADVGWGILAPSLDSQEAFTSMEKLWYLLGGMAFNRQPGTSSRGEKAGGWGTEKSAQTPAMCIFSPPTGESSGHQSSTVDAMHKHFHPSTRDLISTLDATSPASGATPMIICMRGLMTVIRAAYYEATPLGLIPREKKKVQPHLAREGVLTTIFYFLARLFF